MDASLGHFFSSARDPLSSLIARGRAKPGGALDSQTRPRLPKKKSDVLRRRIIDEHVPLYSVQCLSTPHRINE